MAIEALESSRKEIQKPEVRAAAQPKKSEPEPEVKEKQQDDDNSDRKKLAEAQNFFRNKDKNLVILPMDDQGSIGYISLPHLEEEVPLYGPM